MLGRAAPAGFRRCRRQFRAARDGLQVGLESSAKRLRSPRIVAVAKLSISDFAES